jgi:hypothetical protein
MTNDKITISDAIKSLNIKAEYRILGVGVDLDVTTIEWFDNTTPISKSDIQTAQNLLQTEYDSQAYARNRLAEYPSVQELVVALYDTDDKSAIEAKRAAVKLKYPKPE